MKKKLLLILCLACSLVGCGEQPHWSHKDCVEEIVDRYDLINYDYVVKELKYDYTIGDDEVYCFDITIKSGDFEKRFCCFAVVDDGEVLYVDCEFWKGD